MSGERGLDFANLDTGRKERTGFAEVVFCQGKEDSFLRDIFLRLYGANGEVMGTRATPAQYDAVRSVLPGAKYDAVSRLITVRKEAAGELVGNIAVCTAGTADIAVAEEAAQTAEFFGSRAGRIYDVGVSGIHRLLARIILASTRENALILDPFTGSSTTGIAANLLNRRFIGIDKESEYLELSKRRRLEIQDAGIRIAYYERIIR